jgi:hypothetical protein
MTITRRYTPLCGHKGESKCGEFRRNPELLRRRIARKMLKRTDRTPEIIAGGSAYSVRGWNGSGVTKPFYLCRIRGSHSGDYEQFCLLGYYAV